MRHKLSLFNCFCISLFALITLLSLNTNCYARESNEKHILILNSYNADIRNFSKKTDGLKSKLNSSDLDFNITVEHMDTKKFYSGEYYYQLYNLYKYKYSNKKFDLIISFDDNAFTFLTNYSKELFPDTPIVFSGLDYFKDSMIQNLPMFTGIAENAPIKETLDIALKLHKNTKNVVVVTDDSSAANEVKRLIITLIPQYQNRLNFIFSYKPDLLSDANNLKNLPKNSIILLYSGFSTTYSDRIFLDDTSYLIPKDSPVPIYSSWNYYIGSGIVGGKILHDKSKGEEVGTLALKILNGEKPKNIPVSYVTTSAYMFDYNQLKNFRISLQDLPLGSKVINNPSDHYNISTDAIGIIFFAVIGLVSILIFNIYKRQQSKKSLMESERLLNEMAQYEKLRSEFFANISHELRTPINVILSAIQCTDFIYNNNMVEDNKKNLNKYRGMMKQNCYRLIKLVNNLIDVTKIDSGYFEINPGNYNIINIIEDICLSVAPYIENRGLSFVFDTDVEEKIMACDPIVLERVILNLLSNSIKFTNTGGSITVNIIDEGDHIKISVKDTGIGMPEDKKHMIFDRFIQVDKSLSRNREGSGIGLSLVKSLVKMHGGTIIVESEVNKGSEFIITLPVTVIEEREVRHRSSDAAAGTNVEKIKIEFSDIYS